VFFTYEHRSGYWRWHLGWAAKGLGQKINKMLEAEVKVADIRKFLAKIYRMSQAAEIAAFSDDGLIELCPQPEGRVPFSTPVSTEQRRRIKTSGVG